MNRATYDRIAHLDDWALHRWENEGGCVSHAVAETGTSPSAEQGAAEARAETVPPAIRRVPRAARFDNSRLPGPGRSSRQRANRRPYSSVAPWQPLRSPISAVSAFLPLADQAMRPCDSR